MSELSAIPLIFIVMRKLLVILIAALLFGCGKEDPVLSPEEQDRTLLSTYLDLPDEVFSYSGIQLPSYMQTPLLQQIDNRPTTNPVTDWGATLGRVLFYDKLLSLDRNVACANCHRQDYGFSDPEVKSIGFRGGLTGRHSMSLINARFYASGRFFWDERAATLEEQVLHPIQDPVEMGMTLDSLRVRLETSPFYPLLYRKAFGDSVITNERTARALAQFVRSIVSVNSRFDEGMRRTGDPMLDFPNFSIDENLGKLIFFDHDSFQCSGCHYTSAFVSDNPRNNGTPTRGDLGVYQSSGRDADKGLFKAPSLKSIAIRPPYMHDGKFRDLNTVVNHYSDNMTNMDGFLDPHLFVGGEVKRMKLNAKEKGQLIDFLHTLTDSVLIAHPAWSDPFPQ